MNRRDLLDLSIPCLSLLIVCFASGCIRSQSSQTSQSPEPPGASSGPTTVAIEPQTLGIKYGDSWQFAATVNPQDNGVTWRIQEGSSGGMVTDAGVYTAPPIDGVYHVIATSKADHTKSATATVTVGSTGFTLTGSLADARADHTATLLPNGKVYIAGGGVFTTNPNVDDGFDIVSTAELYDPNTGTFQTAGELKRRGHTATLLQNGDVLFVGGTPDDTSEQGDDLTAAAELLKAGSGTLQLTGSMAIARSDHTATLLKDGRVLITGGLAVPWPHSTSTQTAELYDPASGTFSEVGDMMAARSGHSATLLPNGEVLITGGGLTDAELFDPATNSFTPVGSTSSKDASTATLLADGRVLVTGETTPDRSAPAPSELYDPATGMFTPTGTMATVRFGHTATLLPDGTVLIAGGAKSVAGSSPGVYDEVSVTDTEIYDPATGSFNPGPTMRQGRSGATATLLPNGSVLFVGGNGKEASSAYTPLASAEIYR